MEGAGTLGTFLVCVFVYMAVDAMKPRRHLDKEFEKACFGDF